jgi:hypothetical protein
MSNIFATIAGAAALLLVMSATPSFAKDQQVTLTGQASCAKCVLKEKSAMACQTVIEIQRDNKNNQKFYVVPNDVSKAFKPDVCKGPVKVKFTGTYTKVKSKKELTLSKIEEVK